MDVELLTRLEKLETKRRALNAQFDLLDECKSIEELKKRVSLLSDSISSIKCDFQSQNCLVESSCDKLSHIYASLKENNQRFDLLSQLSQLNQLCRQIDHADLSKNKDLFREVEQNYRNVYEPLEKALLRRTDLPYVAYSNKLKVLKLEYSKAVDSTST